MRAKLQVGSVFQHGDKPEERYDQLHFHGVCANKYPEDGSDENNTFAKFSPSVALSITIANPALLGKFKTGDVFYVDFTPVEAKPEN